MAAGRAAHSGVAQSLDLAGSKAGGPTQSPGSTSRGTIGLAQSQDSRERKAGVLVNEPDASAPSPASNARFAASRSLRMRRDRASTGRHSRTSRVSIGQYLLTVRAATIQSFALKHSPRGSLSAHAEIGQPFRGPRDRRSLSAKLHRGPSARRRAKAGARARPSPGVKGRTPDRLRRKVQLRCTVQMPDPAAFRSLASMPNPAARDPAVFRNPATRANLQAQSAPAPALLAKDTAGRNAGKGLLASPSQRTHALSGAGAICWDERARPSPCTAR